MPERLELESCSWAHRAAAHSLGPRGVRVPPQAGEGLVWSGRGHCLTPCHPSSALTPSEEKPATPNACAHTTHPGNWKILFNGCLTLDLCANTVYDHIWFIYCTVTCIQTYDFHPFPLSLLLSVCFGLEAGMCAMPISVCLMDHPSILDLQYSQCL